MKTIREIAEIGDCSKTTVNRAIKDLNLKPKQFKNKYVFEDIEVNRILNYIHPTKENVKTETETQEIIAKPQQNEAKPQQNEAKPQQTENEAKQSETSGAKTETTAPNRTETQLIEFLQKQLEFKDSIISDLSQKLDKQLEINQFNAKHIAYLTKAIEDKKEDSAEVVEDTQPKTEKKSFFSRLFGL